MVVAMTLAVSAQALADPGSDAFNRYLQDLRARMQAIENANYSIGTQVDQAAFQRYLAAMGQSAGGGPGLNDTATYLADLTAQPLRTFNSYLTYLGRRMRADAGPSGALLETNHGTSSFDRYIEEINYRIQSLYQAEDGF